MGSAAATRHANAFGAVRLLLAALVIVSHTPEIIDGDRSRELLTRAFGSLSFGELAVDGFFLVSGLLVTGSWVRSRSAIDFAAKRAGRLYPGFLAATALCLLIVVPLAGGTWSAIDPVDAVARAATLRQPHVDHLFAGIAYPTLDGPMWTIAYEARCYALVMLLGAIGVLARPMLVALLAIALLLAPLLVPAPVFVMLRDNPVTQLLVGDPYLAASMAGCFLVGASFHHRRTVPSRPGLGVAAALLVLGLWVPVPLAAHLAAALAGGWLLLGLALRPPARWLTRLGERDDLSFGIYLYAWPVETLLVWWRPGWPPVAHGLATLAIAAGLALVSWRWIEAPALRATRRWCGARGHGAKPSRIAVA